MNKQISAFIGAATVIMCFVFATFLLFTQLLEPGLSGARRTILILILLGYGIFRGIRVYNDFKSIKQHKK
jgi:hypothetical protein